MWVLTKILINTKHPQYWNPIYAPGERTLVEFSFFILISIISGFREDTEDRRVLWQREDSEDVGQGAALPHQAQELRVRGELIVYISRLNYHQLTTC